MTTADKCPACGHQKSARTIDPAEVLRQVESFAEAWSSYPWMMAGHVIGVKALAVHLLMDAPRVFPSDAERMCDEAIARGAAKASPQPS